jgi:hypothetical protein
MGQDTRGTKGRAASSGESGSSLAATAYHEASHTVVAWYHGRLIEAVTVDLQAPGEGMCHTQNAYLPEWIGLVWNATLPPELPTEQHEAQRHQLRDGIRLAVWTDIKIDLAGALAEWRFLKCRVTGLIVGSEDQRRAWDEAKAYLDAKGGPGHDADPEFYLFLIQRDVQRFLQRPKVWRTVQVVADALLQHGTIEGEELHALLTATYGQRRRARGGA